MDIRELWYASSPIAILLRWALAPLSLLYLIGWKTYLSLYQLGFKKGARVHAPIIVVGNFVVGGSGKTPITIAIASHLLDIGQRIVIGTSGYGSIRQEAASLAPEGNLDPVEWGDESAVIRDLLPGVPLVVGRNRVRAAEICHSEFPDAILLMDDGLQHLPLETDIRIAIEPNRQANRWVLPAGPYREPVSPHRAHLILPGRFQMTRNIAEIRDESGNAIDLDSLRGLEVAVLSGIARPDDFIQELASMGLLIRKSTKLSDHHRMEEDSLVPLLDRNLPTVVTLKDWVKIRQFHAEPTARIFVAYLAVKIEPAAEFADWLNEQIQKAQAKTDF